jgi:hypothetical protein
VLSGRRVVLFQHFFESLKNISVHNDKYECNLQNLKIIKEVQQRLNSIFESKCHMCQMHFKISTNEVQGENMESLEINTSCVEVMSIGCGIYNLQELFSAMDIPSMIQRTYDKYNNIVSDGWERAATIAMQESAKKEAAFTIKTVK